MKIEADEMFSEELMENNDYDAIVMPGGLAGVTNFADNEFFVETIKKYLKDESKIVAAHSTCSIEVMKNNDMLEGYD